MTLDQEVPCSLAEEDTTDFADADENEEGQQTLGEWLDERAAHFGEARVRKLLELVAAQARIPE